MKRNWVVEYDDHNELWFADLYDFGDDTTTDLPLFTVKSKYKWLLQVRQLWWGSLIV